MDSINRVRIALGLLTTIGFLSAAPLARAHDEGCGRSCAAPRSCAPTCCESRCSNRSYGCASSYGYSRWPRYYGYTVYRRYGNWSDGTGISRAYYVAPCEPVCAPRSCRYRFYAGAAYSRAVLGRGYYPWPSIVNAVAVPPPAESDGLDDIVDAETSALPLGERAAAHDAVFRSDYVTAAAKFEALASADAADVTAWIGLAHANFALKQYPESAAALRRAASLGALSATQRLDVEAAYADSKTFQALLSALEARVKFHFMDSDARLVLGYFEAGLGRTKDARDDLARVLRDDAADPCALALLGGSAPKSTPSVEMASAN